MESLPVRILRLIESLLFRSALLLVPLLIHHEASEHTRPVKGAALVFLAACLWGAFLVRSGLSGRWETSRNRFLFPATALLAVGWVSLLYSPCLAAGVPLGLLFFAGWTFFRFASAGCERGEGPKIVFFLMLGAILASSTGWVYVFGFGFPNGPAFQQWTWSTLGNPNFAGQYLILTIPWFLFAFRPKSPSRKTWKGMAILITGGFLVLTVSRGAWLGFLVSMLVVLFLRQKAALLRNKSHWVAAASAVGLIVLFATLLPESYPARKMRQGWEGLGDTFELRREMAAGTLRMIGAEGLFGVGLAGWEIHYPVHRNPEALWVDPGKEIREEAAHNEWLEWVAETGVFGAVALLFLLGVFFKAWRREKWHRRLGPKTASLVGLFATAVQATLSVNFHRPPALLLSALALGVLGAPGPCDRGRSRQRTFLSGSMEKGLQGGRRWILVGAGLVLLLFLPDVAVRHYRAMLLLGKARREKLVGDYPSALEFASRAVEMLPGHPLLLQEAGAAEANLGNHEAAEVLFRDALAVDPYSYNLHFLLGKLHLAEGNPHKAEERFREVLRLVPTHGEGLLALGRLLGKEGRHDEAACLLERALTAQGSPPELEIRYYLGLSHSALGDHQAAVEHFTRALELLDDSPESESESLRQRIESYRSSHIHSSTLRWKSKRE